AITWRSSPLPTANKESTTSLPRMPGWPRVCVWRAASTLLTKMDIHEAVRQGCLDRYGNPLNVAEIRAGCLDDEMWQQEYCCQFLSGGSQWIRPELLEDNIHAEASCGYPSGQPDSLYAGWDISRHHDLSVIWFLEMVGDITWTRGIIVMKNVP